jgi:hypothetical protein
MGLKIGGYLFSGPFDIEKAAIRKHQKPVVFTIISREGQPWDPVFRIIDIDASGPDGVKFADDPRRAEWDKQGSGEIGVYYYEFEDREDNTPERRDEIVSKLRKEFPPPDSVVPIDGMM